mmetsp:Transcript_5856/g.17423  ORF Transcript_5856/g.17423 Transcript_5856/m.17423 type:complete len:213 (+) Transcript_5856:167-805(+)
MSSPCNWGRGTGEGETRLRNSPSATAASRIQVGIDLLHGDRGPLRSPRSPRRAPASLHVAHLRPGKLHRPSESDAFDVCGGCFVSKEISARPVLTPSRRRSKVMQGVTYIMPSMSRSSRTSLCSTDATGTQTSPAQRAAIASCATTRLYSWLQATAMQTSSCWHTSIVRVSLKLQTPRSSDQSPSSVCFVFSPTLTVTNGRLRPSSTGRLAL